MQIIQAELLGTGLAGRKLYGLLTAFGQKPSLFSYQAKY